MATVPNGLLYTKEHEWIKIENGVGTIGITDFAQSALGDIVFVEYPEVGGQITKGKTFGVVESIKSVSDLYAPISGEVVERNEDVLGTPELLNQSPYENWMIKVKAPANLDRGDLMGPEEYEKFCQNS